MELPGEGRGRGVKLLYFSDNTSGHNQRFLEKLSEAGLQVWFLDPTSHEPPRGWLPPGVKWVRTEQTVPRNSDPATFASFLPELQRRLMEISPDLIHAGPIQTSGYVTALSGFHPWLLTSWGSDILFRTDRSAEWEQATRTALSAADSFFCDCDTVRAAARKFADIPDSRIVQLPWGIQRGLFGPVGDLPPGEKYLREAGTHVFLCTRSWEPLYGTCTLLEAFRKAHETDVSLRLLLLGNGSEAGKINEFIEANGLREVIRIFGPRTKEEMPKWFRLADTYVSCAQSDGTSISLLEAMATGLPVVVTDNPSNREWVVEGHNGWLAEVNSSDEFANRLLCAARLKPEERNLFSERNRGLVEQRADWDRNFPRLLHMYEKVTGIAVGKYC
jgi:glycosyltransferase involved in cell wall biosynthesis